MPPSVRAEQGATSMPRTANEPLASGAAMSRNAWQTSAMASTSARREFRSPRRMVRAPAGEIDQMGLDVPSSRSSFSALMP